MKVLVVDDDVVSRMVLMHLIDGCGAFDIVEAEDGEDAWRQLEQGLRPVICFCDLRMPRLSGMDLLRRIKADATLARMPFVLGSAASERATADQAVELGAAGFLVKPFQGEQVRAHMAAFAAPEVVALPAENALASMQRLGINSERLLVYLGGFQSQLVSGAAEIARLLDDAEYAAVQARLERLHAGCVTLGLHGAAFMLDAVGAGGLEPGAVRAALEAAVRAVTHQSESVERMRAPN
jgi:two-component system chemotaxis response regulator CheY